MKSIDLNERNLSIIVHSLFSAWMLALLFEGQILYSLIDLYDASPRLMVFGAITAMFGGLLAGGFFIRSRKGARRLYLYSYPFFIMVTLVLFYPPTPLWVIGIVSGSFLAGCCVAAWAFYLKSGTPQNERIKTIADMLIISNLLMIMLNMAAIHVSVQAGLALSILLLLGAFLFALKLPVGPDSDSDLFYSSGPERKPNSIVGLLAFFCLFIVIITINSGLMYEVINPAFAHLEWLTGWYWALPYIAALFVMRNLSQKVNRSYMLYVAIAMIGFSFIGFMILDRSAPSYLAINTLMLGACGVYDLFWWSILGGMLEFHDNPAQVLGIGLSANVLGVLIGGLAGKTIDFSGKETAHPTLLALTVVCVTLAILPPLHRHLSNLLRDHTYLTIISEMPSVEKDRLACRASSLAALTERENQVAALLLKGKTYKMIAGELFISENTVKYYIKNIYAKLGVQSRTELITLLLEK